METSKKTKSSHRETTAYCIYKTSMHIHTYLYPRRRSGGSGPSPARLSSPRREDVKENKSAIIQNILPLSCAGHVYVYTTLTHTQRASTPSIHLGDKTKG